MGESETAVKLGVGEGKYEHLERVANKYIDAKITMTECMQQHFRQLCTKCREYGRCGVYRQYFHAWMELQKAVGRARR